MVLPEGLSRLMKLQDLLQPFAELERVVRGLDLAEVTKAADVVGQLTRMEVPAVVGQLDRLEIPDVVGQLAKIEVPDVVGQLTKIEVPSLVGQLTKIEVPSVVGQLTKIEVPSLVGQLTKIEVPEVFGKLSRIEVPNLVGQLDWRLDWPTDMVRRTLEAAASVGVQVHHHLDSMAFALGQTTQAWSEWIRQLPLMATAEAREAAVRGDRMSVQAFVVDWLEGEPTEEVVEAVENALLESDWVNVEPELVIGYLRRRVRVHLRRLRFLGETELRGKHVDSLDRLIIIGASKKPLHEMVAGPDFIQQLIKRIDLTEKMKWVKSCFTGKELRMLWRYSQGHGWAMAAVIEGFPPASGEALRRKVRRLREGK